MFCNINNFSKNIVNNIIPQELLKPLKQQDVIVIPKKIVRTCNWFYYMLEKKEHNFYRKWKKQLKKVLSENVKTMVTCQNKKLASKFPVKDKIDF